MALDGDGAMGDGNDVTVAVEGIAWRAGSYGTEQAVLSFASPLDPERYRLTVDGTDGVRDLYGRDLLDGDYARDLGYYGGPVQLVLDLPTAMDTGQSDHDDLTSLTDLEVFVDRPGRLRLDLDDDGKYEIDEYVPRSGTYAYAAGNRIDTDGDRTGGEDPEDALKLNFLLGFDGVGNLVDGSFEAAGAGAGPPESFGLWSGDWTSWPRHRTSSSPTTSGRPGKAPARR